MVEKNHRMPAWAGSFYPADPNELSQLIQSYSAKTVATPETLRGIIMPHAGYIYSGKTASYAEPAITSCNPDTVVLLGPDHHVGLASCHLSPKQYWHTPLGNVKISKNTQQLIKKYPHFFENNTISEQKEHSLEVIIPFLQTWLSDFELLPITTGQTNPEELAKVVKPLLTDTTLLVVSSDLSHFLNDADARKKDNTTIEAILALKTHRLNINDNKACGLIPILTLMTIAKDQGWQPRLLHYSNSGDTSGDKSRVVGYATIGFFEEH